MNNSMEYRVWSSEYGKNKQGMNEEEWRMYSGVWVGDNGE